jgi:hypothetical protein
MATTEPYADDETAVSTSTKTASEPTSSSPGAAPPVGIGPLLEKDPEEAIKLTDQFWEDCEPMVAEYSARWKANEKRREGVIGVQVVKPDPDRAEWKVWAPPGAARVPPTFNQAARLARRLKANLFVDEPLPEVTPGGASDSDKPDAAEFQTRILQDVCTSSKFNVPEIGEAAVDKAITFDSGFVRVIIDPKGSGSRPRTIEASQAATTVDDALYIDPEETQPQPPPYVTRYVRKDGTLSDDPAEAALEWLPGLRYEHLTGRNLRPIPATATSIEDCDGIIIRTPVKLGDLRKQYRDAIDALSTDELWELVGSRPNKASELAPAHVVDAKTQRKDEEPPPDHVNVIVTMVYMGENGAYPAGAYFVSAGKKFLLHRQKWQIIVNETPETLPIPIAHFKGWSEGRDTFYGYHLMHFLGPGNEVRAAAIGGAIEHIDRFNRRKIFYTPQSLFQPKANPAAMGVMVPIQQGSKPQVEEFPDYPKIGMEILQFATGENNDESGLLPIAQGQTDPSVTSGLHAQKVIEQVNIGLGDIKRSTNKGVIQLWTIASAFIRGYFTIPQQIRFRGDDQEYKQQDFSGVDLADAKDVRIMKGSFTMLAPSAKLAVAEYMRKLNLITDDQLRRMAAGNIGGLMGIQDDPALLRIRRQIALWEKGPPKAQHPAEPMPDSYPGETVQIGAQGTMAPAVPEMPAQDPAIVGSIPPAVPQTDPMMIAGAQIFAAVPNDEEPAVAQIRFQELSRSMCSKKYDRQPKPWRNVFDAEYQRMRKAAGVGTAAESAANQAAAQKAQQDATLAQEQAKTQAQLQLEQLKQQNQLALAQLKSQETLQLEALRAQNALALEKLRLEHESAMKNAELSATGDGSAEAMAKVEQKRMELEAEAEANRAKLAQEFELEREKIAANMVIEREKMEHSNKLENQKLTQSGKIELKKAQMAANPAEAAEVSLEPVKKRIEIFRDDQGKITGAEIIPEPAEETAPTQKEA